MATSCRTIRPRTIKLLVNEIAPRVHNSGHWTQDACFTGQFEQHIRAVCGWPLGDPTRHSDGEMLNLLGEDANAWEQHLAEGAKLHLYGKREARSRRKMGHFTVLGDTIDQALNDALAIRKALGID